MTDFDPTGGQMQSWTDPFGNRTEGETRRQALARCAMQAMICGLWTNPDGSPCTSDKLAKQAYKYADAMLRHEFEESKNAK